MESKISVPILTKALIIEELVHFESNLRRIFYNGSEAKLKSRGDFTFDGIEVTSSIFSAGDKEMFVLDKDKHASRIAIIANYQVKKNGKWESYTKLINNRGGTGIICYIPASNQKEFENIFSQSSQIANELGSLIYDNWKQIKPSLNEYLKDAVTTKMTLWGHPTQEHKLMWVTCYQDVATIAGTTEGYVRDIVFDQPTFDIPQESRLCTKEDFNNFFMSNGTMRKVVSLKERLQEESEFNKTYVYLKNLLSI